MGVGHFNYIHQRDMASIIDRLSTLLMADYLSSPQVLALIHYFMQAGESADHEAFVCELAQRVPQHGDALMTIAHQLEQKGIAKGLENGRAEEIELGEQRGMEKGRSKVSAKPLWKSLALCYSAALNVKPSWK